MEPSAIGSLDAHGDTLNPGDQAQGAVAQDKSESNNESLDESTTSSTGFTEVNQGKGDGSKDSSKDIEKVDDAEEVDDDTDGKVSSKMKSKKKEESVSSQPVADVVSQPEPEVSHTQETDLQETIETKAEVKEAVETQKTQETVVENIIEKDSESGDSQEDFVKVDPKEIEADMAQRDAEEEVAAGETSEEKKVEETPGFVDILGNGSLTKKILTEAPEDAAKPQQYDWVEVSYEMYISGQDKVLESESNRKICVQDMDIVQGIDLSLMLMKSGEKAEIFMSSDKAYGPNGRSEVNVPPNSDLTFVLTLIRICESPGNDELIQIVERRKLQAKELFLAKDYQTAVFIYGRSLTHLDQVDLHNSELALSLKSNLAQAFLNMQRYDLALQHAMSVVNQDPNNTKALLRLGKAYNYLGDLKRAERVLSKAANLEPTNKTILNELNTVKTKSKKSLESQKKIYGRMFGLEKPEDSKKAKEKEGNTQYYVAGAVVAAGLASLGYSLYKSLT